MLEIFRGGQVETSAGEVLTFSPADLAAIAAGYDPALHEHRSSLATRRTTGLHMVG